MRALLTLVVLLPCAADVDPAPAAPPGAPSQAAALCRHLAAAWAVSLVELDQSRAIAADLRQRCTCPG
jgi:hypothetical protein